jgi:hypothetical protein
MSQRSSIEWTDWSWNPTTGCTPISPGCKNCYGKTFAERWRGIPGHPYEQGFDLRVPVFVKQLGTRWSRENGFGSGKGNHPETWPEDLRVREMPLPSRRTQ